MTDTKANRLAQTLATEAADNWVAGTASIATALLEAHQAGRLAAEGENRKGLADYLSLSAERVAEIRRVCGAEGLTPPPWGRDGIVGTHITREDGEVLIAEVNDQKASKYFRGCGGDPVAVANFIASSRAALPELLAEYGFALFWPVCTFIRGSALLFPVISAGGAAPLAPSASVFGLVVTIAFGYNSRPQVAGQGGLAP